MQQMSTTMEQEIATQPAVWAQAAALATARTAVLPAAGERVCAIGCGTSLFMAQAYAALRERAGHGWTDAFPASELPAARAYDVLLAISRSGTTSEVVHALGRGVAGRTVALTADAGSPVGAAAGVAVELPFADERSIVQTRFATGVLSLLRETLQPGAAVATAADAARALSAPLPVRDPAAIEQWTFLGQGWTVGLAHEAALKLRESAQAWTEAYPLFEYRHGPISIAAPGRVIWSLGPLEPAVAAELQATGATVVAERLDPLAGLVRAQRLAAELARARGLDPDHPRNLTRSVVLADRDLELLS
jgi:fructoselysine-6-P-deglycase FrlB-like protein